jgi:MFS transporter, NNP family, nitrate/nitrite transporter
MHHPARGLHLWSFHGKTLILNVALTIPARIIVGMVVDRFGPRISFTGLLVAGGGLCFLFAAAESYELLALSRFLLGFVGAGFVIGIRMIGEWFPARQVGLAQGIYAGWGNFGSAAAAITLPTLALSIGGAEGWRYAVASTGVITIVYALVYYLSARDTPEGATYFKPNKHGGLEVTSRGDFFCYLVMNAPLYLALSLLATKLAGLGLLSEPVHRSIDLILLTTYCYQCLRIYQINARVFVQPRPSVHRYKFKQVAILSLAYAVAFGSELAVVSMLPLFFPDTFGLSSVTAGLIMNAMVKSNSPWNPEVA